jgi:hypothetical protein
LVNLSPVGHKQWCLSLASTQAHTLVLAGIARSWTLGFLSTCVSLGFLIFVSEENGPPSIRHQCKETIVLCCHGCLINTGVEKLTTLKYRLKLWPPDVTKYEEKLVFKQLFILLRLSYFCWREWNTIH